MVELSGGPGDGKRFEFPDEDQAVSFYEIRHTCTNPDHSEIRSHSYTPEGAYEGVGEWRPRITTSLPSDHQ